MKGATVRHWADYTKPPASRCTLEAAVSDPSWLLSSSSSMCWVVRPCTVQQQPSAQGHAKCISCCIINMSIQAISPSLSTVMPAALQISKLHGLSHDRARLYLAAYTAQEIHQWGIVQGCNTTPAVVWNAHRDCWGQSSVCYPCQPSKACNMTTSTYLSIRLYCHRS